MNKRVCVLSVPDAPEPLGSSRVYPGWRGLPRFDHTNTDQNYHLLHLPQRGQRVGEGAK